MGKRVPCTPFGKKVKIEMVNQGIWRTLRSVIYFMVETSVREPKDGLRKSWASINIGREHCPKR